ncbi:hypothetical protein E2562_024118 [Oryza meyeriana var. granulata]|uniref:Uncharacterized protein n=1 Tax=Oryza meyeriana var. granulata TaxID=110450 RepID=A0A6G1EP48_9ORYZ|nr:hypothetical protein E2562_024118 [Oryza meyeriana var. granulata]
MGTEVLRPHDCLDRVRAHAQATKRSPRQQAARRRDARPRGGQAAPVVTRVVRVKVAAASAADAYAGPAFGAMSPSPRALPLPRFSSSREAAAAAAAAGVDDSATRELRRLLGLH